MPNDQVSRVRVEWLRQCPLSVKLTRLYSTLNETMPYLPAYGAGAASLGAFFLPVLDYPKITIGHVPTAVSLVIMIWRMESPC
jgi:hypothetical protein